MKPQKGSGAISWQAPEYTEHRHSLGWFLLLGLACLGLAALIYLLTTDIFALVIILLLGLIVGVSASHKPQMINYVLRAGSVSMGDKNYLLSRFGSFSAVDEDHLVAATLDPLKRFALPVTIYMLPEQADAVLAALNQQLAHDDRPADLVDRLAHRLRF